MRGLGCALIPLLAGSEAVKLSDTASSDSLRVLITAGPTREPIDAVRFLSNRSTGRMGIELAHLISQQHQVTLVLGPTELAAPAGVEVIRVESAAEMYQAVKARFAACDVFISSAAVADYTPAQVHQGKLKKSDGPLTLELARTVDILAWAGEHKRAEQMLVGFALETDPSLALARAKLEKKRCDLLVHNSPANFGAGGGAVRLCTPAGVVRIASGEDKAQLAREIWETASALRAGNPLEVLEAWPE